MRIGWHYLFGFIPLLLLIFPNKRSTRAQIAVIAGALLLYIWSGLSKGQKIEKDFTGWTLQNMAERIEKGQSNEVWAALSLYTKTHSVFQYDGYKFRMFMQDHMDPINNPSEQGGPGYPPQGVGSPDP